MKITDIKIRKLLKSGKMKAIFSITFDDQLVVHDIKLIESREGYFLAMPSRRLENGDFIDSVHPVNKDFRSYIENKILAFYLNCLLEKESKK